MITQRQQRDTQPTTSGSRFVPVLMHEVELTEPMAPLTQRSAVDGRSYGATQVLVRLGGQPLGVCDVALGVDGVSAEALASAIWQQLGTTINRHLSNNGNSPLDTLPLTGVIVQTSTPERPARVPFVSVVIATRNRPETLLTTVHDLLASDYPTFEIIVVDNAPSDNATREAVAVISRRDHRVSYLREERKGVSWARNLGLTAAKGEIVAFLDDDLRVDRRWLHAIVDAFSATDGIGCVSGMILPLEMETEPQAFIEQYGGYCKGFERTIYDLRAYRPNHPLFPFAAGMFGSGACLAFRTAIFRALGGFDPAVGAGTPALGGEDLAAMFHIVASGYRLVYEPAAIVRHRHYREYSALQRQMHGYGTGLTAFLTQAIMTRPRMLPQLLRNVPRGVRYALSPKSPKNARKYDGYPRELTHIEWRGMAYGPLAYLRGRRLAHQLSDHRANSAHGFQTSHTGSEVPTL